MYAIRSYYAVSSGFLDGLGTEAAKKAMTAWLEEEVKYSMQEQSAGSSQILESLSSINEVTADVRNSAQEMQEGSNAVLTEMRQLLQLASERNNFV